MNEVAVEEVSPTEQNGSAVDLDIGGRTPGFHYGRHRGVGSRRRVHNHRDDRGAGILQTGGDQAKSRRRCVRLAVGMGWDHRIHKGGHDADQELV